MPVLEPTVLDLHQYSMRHIGPKATVYPDTIGSEYTVLNRTDMVARPLPPANIPNTVDFASGKWDGRLNDAGDATLVWPNKESSDGVPWRQRFDPTNKLQWLEIWVDEFLEQVICVTKVTPDRNQVQVDGYDGIQMLKSAYTRDWTCVKSPRDVFERGTQVWVPGTTDNFQAAALAPQWVTITSNGGTVSTSVNNGLTLTVTDTGTSTAGVESDAVVFATQTWTSSMYVSTVNQGAEGSLNISLIITELTTGDIYEVILGSNEAFGTTVVEFAATSGSNSSSANATISPAASYVLMLESDGEWVSGFCNGQLIGQLRRYSNSTSKLRTRIQIENFAYGGFINVLGVLTEYLAPFLMRGTDKGDYVLPGGASSNSPPYSSEYSSGGLHARYYNDTDLYSVGSSQYYQTVLAPTRSQAYSGSGVAAEYYNQQDATVDAQDPPSPAGVSAGPNLMWSCKWFGSVYLPLATYPGNYVFKVDTDGTSAVVRLWVGRTAFGTQIIDEWAFNNAAYTATLASTTLNGTLPYGEGTIARDGWYPIILEYGVGANTGAAPILSFTPPSSYTDPGGTALTGGTSVVIPSTSLSPLGCEDNRYQGTSHYDLTQKTALAFGYQYALEPYQLESGLFPGVVAPRAVRSQVQANGSSVTTGEGTNYDTVIEPDDTQRREGMINYSSVLDGTDEASSMQGNGAGFQNGNAGQLQANVYDPPTLQNALFDMQDWQDVADAAFSSVLGNVLNSQLAQRLGPWLSVSGDPIARERRAFTWPLSGALANMRWRPGDGVRVAARDINIQDTVPRQLLLVTRNIQPNGAVSTQVNFASRPKSPQYSQRQQISAAMRPLRNYQRQLVTLSSNYTSSSASGGIGNPAPVSAQIALQPSDTVVHAYVRFTFVDGTSPSWGLGVYNGSSFTDETTSLGGPWNACPLQVNVGSIVTITAAGFAVVLINKSANAISLFQYQLFVDVLR